MWNHFSNFSNGNSLILRVSIYNPRYLMPAQTSVRFNVNIPPRMCNLKISPAKGIEFETEFLISITSCTDEDKILTYQYWYYINEDV